jgi:NAD(P)H-dependent FMN reductase
MKLFMFAASLRQDSCNKKLITVAEKLAQAQGATVDLADFSEVLMPAYNADVQDKQGFPQEVTQFVLRMKEAQALVIASPEYNYSTPGNLKNIIDWVSRLTPMPWKNYPVLLLSASPSLVGGNRGLWATRIPLEACGSFVFPDMFSLSAAYSAFDEKGELKDEAMSTRLNQTLSAFMAFASSVPR